MDSKSEIRCDHFTGGEVMNLPLNFFEGSDEEIINGVRQQKEKQVLW